MFEPAILMESIHVRRGPTDIVTFFLAYERGEGTQRLPIPYYLAFTDFLETFSKGDESELRIKGEDFRVSSYFGGDRTIGVHMHFERIGEMIRFRTFSGKGSKWAHVYKDDVPFLVELLREANIFRSGDNTTVRGTVGVNTWSYTPNTEGE